MGAYGFGDGELVSALGRLWPTYAGDGSRPPRAGRCAGPAASPVSHGWLESLSRGAPPGRGHRVSSPASWARGAQAEAPTRRAKKPVLRPGGQGPQQDGPGRGGQSEGGLRWPAPFSQTVALTATREDDPDSLYGTVGWYPRRAGGPPTPPHPVSFVEPPPPPGEGLAAGQALQFRDAAQEPAPRSHAAHPGDGHRADRPRLELEGVYLAASAYRPSPHHADG